MQQRLSCVGQRTQRTINDRGQTRSSRSSTPTLTQSPTRATSPRRQSQSGWIASGSERAGRTARSTAGPDTQDRGDQIVSCQWADHTTLFVLRRNQAKGTVERFTRPTAPTVAWGVSEVSSFAQNGGTEFPAGDLIGTAPNQTRPFLRFLPADVGRVSEIAVGPIVDGHHSLYVGHTGASTQVPATSRGGQVLNSPTGLNLTEWDTLYWFDGTDKWFPTGLRTTPAGAAPVLSVVADDKDPTIVYAGTNVGVMKGARSVDAAGNSTWAWSSFALGLPSRAVQDLTIFNSAASDADPATGTHRLLRAVLPASGLWEIDLDQPLAKHTWLRVHARDTGRNAVARLDVPRDENTNRTTGGAAPSFTWTASPDIAMQPASGTLDAWPAGKAKVLSDDSHKWIFKTALFSLDPTFDVGGGNTKGFLEALKRMRSARGVAGGASPVIAKNDWNALKSTSGGRVAATFCAPPWTTDAPSEADLMQRAHQPAVFHPELSVVGPGAKSLYVLTHHRDARGVPGGDVDVVALFRTVTVSHPASSSSGPAVDAAWGSIAVPGAFKTRVVSLLGGTATTAPAGWTLATAASFSPSTIVSHPLSRVNARAPGAASFDLTVPPPTGTTQAVLVLAIAGSTVDPVTTGTLIGSNLRDLVLSSRHVACHVFQVNAALKP